MLRCLPLQIRPLWRHYFENTQGLIFVVDSADRARMGEARDELHNILKEVCAALHARLGRKGTLPSGLALAVSLLARIASIAAIHWPRHTLFDALQAAFPESAVVLVLANKQDLPGAMSAAEITEALDLSAAWKRNW